MPATFACSGCGFKTKVKDQLAGKKIKCPKCGVPGAVSAGAAAAQEEAAPDAFLNVNLGSFQDVITEEGEELPPEMAPKGPAKPVKKKKAPKGKSKYAPVSGGAKGAALLFSLISVAVIAMLVMFVLPDVISQLQPKESTEKPAAPPAQGS